jgi:hypothetical protein
VSMPDLSAMTIRAGDYARANAHVDEAQQWTTDDLLVRRIVLGLRDGADEVDELDGGARLRRVDLDQLRLLGRPLCADGQRRVGRRVLFADAVDLEVLEGDVDGMRVEAAQRVGWPAVEVGVDLPVPVAFAVGGIQIADLPIASGLSQEERRHVPLPTWALGRPSQSCWSSSAWSSPR